MVVLSVGFAGVGLSVVGLLGVSTVFAVGTVRGAVATVSGLAVSLGTTVGLSNGITSRGVGTVGGGTVDVVVTAPSLGAPLVGILVVPLIVGLSIVGLGPCLLVGLVDLEILIATPSIPLGAGFASVSCVTLDRGGVSLATVALAVASVASVATVLGPDGSSLAVLGAILVVVTIVVLSPLVVISLEPSGVLLVVVGTSLDGIVRFAPSGILVLTVGLLGPGVVIVAVGRSGLLVRSALPDLTLVSVALAVGTVLSVGTMVSGGLAVSGLGSLGGRGLGAVGRGTIDILIGAPSLTAPLVSIAVVPLIVRLGLVGLGIGIIVRDLLMEVLVTAIGVPAVGVTTPVVGGAILGCLLEVGAVAGGGAGGSGLTVLVLFAFTVAMTVLSPLVVISTNLASVVLVVVVVGLNRVVGFAPPVVGVLAVSLLGPCVVIVTRHLGTSFPGSFISISRGAVVLGSVSGFRGVVLVGRGTLLIEVTAPALTTPLVVILVVPFIVGLGTV